jgi:hypothetical protein
MLVGKIIVFFYNEHPPFLYEKLLMMLLFKRDYTGNILLLLVLYTILTNSGSFLMEKIKFEINSKFRTYT